MNKLLIFTVIISFGILYSCTGPEGKKANVGDADTISANIEGADRFIIDTTTSIVEWKGFKPTGQHNGTLTLKHGELFIKENTPVGGEFIIDMNSLKVLDIEDPEYNGKLKSHLLAADFFDVDANPEARFVITQIIKSKESSSSYTLTGNLTIKGITKSISFVSDITTQGEVFSASTPEFTIDRVEFDIKYKSKKFFDDLKDDFINDEIALVIKLSGKKAL